MLFTLETNLLLLVAALLAERALQAVQRPARHVWMLAMLGSVLIPLTAWFPPSSRVTTNPVGDAPTQSVNASTKPVVDESPAPPTPSSSAQPASPSSHSLAASAHHALASSAFALNVHALSASIGSQLEVKPHSAFQQLNSLWLIAWLVIVGLAAMVCLFAVAGTMKQRAR